MLLQLVELLHRSIRMFQHVGQLTSVFFLEGCQSQEEGWRSAQATWDSVRHNFTYTCHSSQLRPPCTHWHCSHVDAYRCAVEVNCCHTRQNCSAPKSHCCDIFTQWRISCFEQCPASVFKPQSCTGNSAKQPRAL